MSKPSLIVISAFPPCVHTAGENFTRHLVTDLAQVYDLTVYYFVFDGHEVAPDVVSNPSVSTVGVTLGRFQKILNSAKHPFTHPLFSARLLDRRSARQTFLIEPGVPVLYNFSQVFEISRYFPGNPSLFLCHDVILQKVSRGRYPLSGLVLQLARATERRVLTQRPAKVFTLSEKDSKLLDMEYGVVAVPLSVYISREIRDLDYDSVQLSSGVCMFGAWSRPENLESLKWATTNLLPVITRYTSVQIIGSIADPETVRDLMKLGNVTVTGFVKNPYQIIAASSCLLAPLFRGAGIKLKVVESLACGTPVVSSEVGFEGIDFPPDGLSSICASTSDYLDSVLKVVGVSLEKKKALRRWFLSRHRDRNLQILAEAMDNV